MPKKVFPVVPTPLTEKTFTIGLRPDENVLVPGLLESQQVPTELSDISYTAHLDPVVK
jgi:hypothetical protein